MGVITPRFLSKSGGLVLILRSIFSFSCALSLILSERAPGESEKLGEKFKKSDQKSLSLSLEKATQILKNRD